MIEFFTEWSLKLYSITKFKYFSFQINLYFKDEIYMCVYIIQRTLSLNLNTTFGKNLNKISKIKNDVLYNVLNEVGLLLFCHKRWVAWW